MISLRSGVSAEDFPYGNFMRNRPPSLIYHHVPDECIMDKEAFVKGEYR